MSKMQENKKINMRLIGKSVFVNELNGERFSTISEIEDRKGYRVIVEKEGYEIGIFCESYKQLLSTILSANAKDKITVYPQR